MKSKNEQIWLNFEPKQAETKFVLSSFRQFETAHQSELSGGVHFGSQTLVFDRRWFLTANANILENRMADIIFKKFEIIKIDYKIKCVK